MTEEPRAFQLTGPLPTGLTALEASAGTGKTYALTALAVRYVAERNVSASGLCVVSFTEAATAELRGRIRSRMVEAAEHLAAPDPESGDDLLVHLVQSCVDDADRLGRVHRLRQAVADFDATTITTIHGFCRRVLATASGGVADRLIDSGDHDIDEVVNDLVLARLGHDGDSLIRPDRVVAAVTACLAMPDARLRRPDLPSATATSARAVTEARRRQCSIMAADLVEECVAEVRLRRVEARRRTFTELLDDTRSLLRHPQHGAPIAGLLRDRYRVVLVDEFQDTDRVQWDIFRTAFVDPPTSTTVVVVGDPKQSIYRFRSADLDAYLDARHTASNTAGLSTNWRSDAPLLTALDTLFTGYTFGSPEVVFQPVHAAQGREQRGLLGAGSSSLQFRVVTPDLDDTLDTPTAHKAVRNDVVRVAAELLAGGVTIPDSRGEQRPLRARDIAVLTSNNRDATMLALQLGVFGIPAATASASSVLDTEAAAQWGLLLRALERPGHRGYARAAALSWFIGHHAADIAALDDDGVSDLHQLLRDWADVVDRGGVPLLLQQARSEGLHRRLLSRPGGERDLTDVDHVAELLQATTAGRPVGVSSVLAALDHLVAHATDDEGSRDAVARRIDRDDDAVQVLTVHRAKGLEFPVVLCPYLWSAGGGDTGIPHAQGEAGYRELDATWICGVSSGVALVKDFRNRVKSEQEGERRRLLYVALTRARHRCVVWWAATSTAAPSRALSDLLLNAAGDEGELPRNATEFTPIVLASGGTIEAVDIDVQTSTDRLPAAPSDNADALATLDVSTIDRPFDRQWRIWSFTSITAAANDLAGADHDATAAPESGGHDEPAPPTAHLDSPRPSRWSDLPAGARFGTLVHRLFERCDFTSPTLLDDLTTLCHDELVHQRLDVTASALAEALVDAIHAPLGGPVPGLRLADLDRVDRLDELDFHLPLASTTASDIGRVLARHLAPDDLLLPWAEQMARHGFHIEVEGMLTGSIDLVARCHDANGTVRYWVADYKSNVLDLNRLYDRSHLAEAMAHSHYPLQASLYLLALHRYLRWRLPHYDPERHLGGAAYLFVRGMDPALSDDGARGVFWWNPPTAAIIALDDLVALGSVA